jgi:hypothetical protein
MEEPAAWATCPAVTRPVAQECHDITRTKSTSMAHSLSEIQRNHRRQHSRHVGVLIIDRQEFRAVIGFNMWLE